MSGFTVPILDSLSKLVTPTSIISLLVLAALVIILAVISKKTTYNTHTLTYGALSIAAAFVLSFLKILQLPNGGTITVASMLPLFIFAYIAGPAAGMAAGLCYGLLDFIREPYAVHWLQVILDYPLAFAVLGLAGCFKKNIYLGAIVGGAARFICHFLSGVIFFGSYAAPGQSVFAYSLLYNGSYLLPDIIICLVILLIPNVRSAVTRVRNNSFQV